MRKHLLLVGGGHAHMMVLAEISRIVEKGYDVTVIGPSAYHYYSGMGPGMLGKSYSPDDIRFHTKQEVERQGGRFLLGKAVRVDPEKRIVYTESEEAIPYDIVSFNAGSHVPTLNINGGFENIYSVKPIERLLEARNQIESLLDERPIKIGVIGGGASSAEIAGNIWQLAENLRKNKAEISIFSRRAFMGHFPKGIRNRAFRSLTKRGVRILEHSPVREIRTGQVILETAESHELDFLFLALGVRPSNLFKASGLPTGPDGGLRVNKYLQSTTYPDIFGGGDCIYFQDQPLDKVGVYAVRQNPVLLHNLIAQLEGNPLEPFDPGGNYLLIFNMGDGTGILNKKWLTFGGRLAFKIKDMIDRKFMMKFQASE